MHIAVVPDKYKGCLTAEEVGEAIISGVRDYDPMASCHPFYISDGGDGFLDAIQRYRPELRRISVPTVNAMGQSITGTYLVNQVERTAYFELASASGLASLNPNRLDVVNASTYGTGLEIAHALKQGVENIIIGLGGSATNDLGQGIARALGYRLFNEEGEELKPGLLSLKQVHHIKSPQTSLEKLNWTVINDVDNPLLGPEGATRVYGPQKGVTPELIDPIEKGIAHLATLFEELSEKEVRDIPGSGAAGGTAFGLMSLFKADSVQGSPFLLELTGFSNLLSSGEIDAVITGEGKMDTQTAYGKLIAGVAKVSGEYEVPVGAICGMIQEDLDWEQLGLNAALSISELNPDPRYSYHHAADLIRQQTKLLIEQLLDN
ncbi:glycerate kinase [Aureitalea marina]|uniref:Glycerate kinase n=1 Tax=Aureitalea marina TaxID=930804 RepID=A0A2S7KMY7_9FLAO|nr:glycerate kinase [Aureitalea marina]PQB03996.1 hypothetical protein BST85_03080 [Aureitalea marina]